MLKYLFILMLPLSSIWAQIQPTNQSSFDQSLDLSTFYKINESQQLFFNLHAINQNKRSNRKIIEFNYRFSWHLNWRAGLIVKRAYGLRHNNDWTKNSGQWAWNDSTTRGENLIGLMLQYKHVAWGRGKGVLKNRISVVHNFFNAQNTLLYKFGILNFQWRNWTTVHQFELGFPLNYNRHLINELWHYSAFMFNFTSWLKLGPKLSVGKIFWDESKAFHIIKNSQYTQNLLIYRIGLGVLITL